MSRTILKVAVVLVLVALAWKLVGGDDEAPDVDA